MYIVILFILNQKEKQPYDFLIHECDNLKASDYAGSAAQNPYQRASSRIYNKIRQPKHDG